MRKGKVVYFKDKNLMWRFRFVAGNGEIICQSEQYSSKQMAMKGVLAIMSVCLDILK